MRIPINALPEILPIADRLTEALLASYPEGSLRTPLTIEEARNPEQRPLGARNILGFGVGEKWTNGAPTGEPAICAYVVRKLPPELVEDQFLVKRFVSEYAGFPSDVIEVGRPTLQHHDTHSYTDTVPGGASIGDGQGHLPPGTLGCWLTDDQDKKYFLTCWHCVDGGSATLGASTVLQPPGSGPAGLIGTLRASINPLTCPTGTATVDAALVELTGPRNCASFILRVGEIRGIEPNTPHHVRKSGVTSHLTYGIVQSLCSAFPISAPPVLGAPANTINYDRQWVIYNNPPSGCFSHPGDSGAIVLTHENDAVGLIVAGGGAPVMNSSVSLATPIDDVLTALEHKLHWRLKLLTWY